MAIIKRYIKKNGIRKVCYQAQVYVQGVRQKYKTFKNKTEASVWHDKQKEQFLKNPSEFYQEKPVMFFSDCLKQYKEEAIPLLQKSSQQSYEFHLRYFMKGPLSNIRMEHLNAKAIHAWLQWLKEHRSNPVYWRLATFMLLTGARVGEACGMLWSVVDFKQGTASVVRRIRWDHNTRRPHLEDTSKTEASVRLLLLSDELIEILKQMKEENGDEGLLFMDKKGEALKYNAIQSSFNAGFVALKLPWRSTHILRHSYATMALIATKDLSSVQASLGHTSSRMTERYAKVVALLNRDIAQKTTKAFNLFNGELKA